MLAFGKANAAGSLKLSKHATRLYATAPATASTNSSPAPLRPADPSVQRELLMNVLNANATKRDAKQYLARFRPPKPTLPPAPNLSSTQEERNARHRKDQDRLERLGVNLGELYAPARAIAESPQFSQQHIQEKTATESSTRIHVALVCLRNPETLDDTTLDGVALTLSQLVKLDMRILVVLDCNGDSSSHSLERGLSSLAEIKTNVVQQGERLTKAIAKHSAEGARIVQGALETNVSNPAEHDHAVVPKTSVGLPKLLMEPLKRAVIPIIPCIAYTASGQLLPTSVSNAMEALTSMLSGLPTANEGSKPTAIEASLDRIIVLDSAGGVPSKARGDGAHVLINLEQEFDDIEAELADYGHEIVQDEHAPGMSNIYEQHRTNLGILQECLAMLPSASSALIITPQEAASSSQAGDSDESTIGAGTRRQKNNLIHNLLTNKPMVSSSLPVARLPATTNGTDPTTSLAIPTATLVKRGMPLTIIPSPDRRVGWRLPSAGTTSLSLENDPRVDFPRLLHLIEDSFRRKLDVRDYLSRIQNRIAGLIVASSYEGGAILTWEMPPGTSDPTRLVPYLDKFAVLSSSQGSSGVADVVFQSMVRSCFPAGVCWRSRKDNPVNKWYFERSDGTWQIPGTNWTMFWTGEGVVENPQRWDDYVGVCTNVKPSWADGRMPD